MEDRNAYDPREVTRGLVATRLLLIAKARSAGKATPEQEADRFTDLLNFLPERSLEVIESAVATIDAHAMSLISNGRSLQEKIVSMTDIAEEQAIMLMEM